MTDRDWRLYEKLVKANQEYLWANLAGCLNRSVNGYWSVEAETCVEQIIHHIRIDEITPWGKIQIPLLAAGIYTVIADKADVPIPIDKIEDVAYDFPVHAEHPSEWAYTLDRIRAMEVEDFEYDEG